MDSRITHPHATIHAGYIGASPVLRRPITPSADDVVYDAFDGEAILELPTVAAAEAMYIAYNRTEIAGRPFRRRQSRGQRN